jgi:stage II sporulation protein R
MNYGAKATYENSYVPTKEYKSVLLPQGYYNCLKVVLGDGVGENWWCIAYPPLCYTESMFGDLSENGIEELSSIFLQSKENLLYGWHPMCGFLEVCTRQHCISMTTC